MSRWQAVSIREMPLPRGARRPAPPASRCRRRDPATARAIVTSSSFATSAPREVEIARQTTHAPTATRVAFDVGKREPDEAELRLREKEVERTRDRLAAAVAVGGAGSDGSGRRPQGTRRAARTRRRASPTSIGAQRDGPERRGASVAHSRPATTSGSSAARMRGGIGAGRCVAGPPRRGRSGPSPPPRRRPGGRCRSRRSPTTFRA